MSIFFRIFNRAFQYQVLYLLLVLVSVPPSIVYSEPTIPGFYGSSSSPQLAVPSANQLPVLDQVIQGAALEKEADNKLVIHQNQEKASINWTSFDIGSNAWTHFDQQGNTDWTVLNRIYDQNPSQIYGRLTADGRVFLLNQNGILFGPGSQVNVHSLVASSLNLSGEDFYEGILSYHLDNYTGQEYDNPENIPEESCVANHGSIETGQGGWVFLMGPNVENSGTISSPLGQVGLAAGTDIELEYEQEYNPDSSRTARLVNVKGGSGVVDNMETGELISDMGTVGMYGRIVNQDGLVRSVTAVEKDGNIELIASQKVSLGPESYTGCPVSTSSEEVHESFDFEGGDIQIHAHDTENPRSDWVLPTERVELYGTVEAPSGLVNMAASERIYLESCSRIDVGGSVVNNSVSANVIEAQLNSVEMRDDHGQKNGILQGEYINFNTLEGSSIGDVSGHLISEEKTAGEFSTSGGEIYLTCETGDIIVKENAGLDFSGGGIHYTAGPVETTKLVSGHQVYDISNAPQWIQYEQVLGSFQKTYDRFGVIEEYEGIHYGGPGAFKELTGGYFYGDDAGRLEIVAPQIVLDGFLDGSAMAGAFQTELYEQLDENGNQVTVGTTQPRGGTLVLGARVESNEWKSPEQNRVVEEIVIKKSVAPLSDITAESEIPQSEMTGGDTYYYSGGDEVLKTLLGADKLNAAGLDTIELNSNTYLTIEKEASLSLSPGGNLMAWARQLKIDGNVSVPSGSVILKANESYTAAEELLTGGNVFSGQGSETIENTQFLDMPGGIVLGNRSKIDVSGENIDNTDAKAYQDYVVKQGHLDGGNIHLIDQTDANFYERNVGLVIPEGSELDVSGGYQIDLDSRLRGGNAGEIKLTASDMILDGRLEGYSLQGYDGGTISLLAKKLTVVPESSETDINEYPDTMILSDSRFNDFGFCHYNFESFEDLSVESGAVLTPSLVKLPDPTQPENSVDIANTQLAREAGAIGTPEESTGYSGLVEISEEYLGDSSIKLWAANSFENVTTSGAINILSRIKIEPDAQIQVAPSGAIKLEATGIQMAGNLSAPAGSIELTTDGIEDFNLFVTDTGRISAKGYNSPDSGSIIDGTPVAYSPLDGGQVSLTSSASDIFIENGALIDVSGSDPVDQLLIDVEDGVGIREIASNPGSIVLSFMNSLDIQSAAESLKACGKMPGIQGGSLTIEKTDETKGLIISSIDGVGQTDGGENAAIDLNKIIAPESGFDDLSVVSANSIEFVGDHELETSRQITLDAPLIFSESTYDIQLESSWVTIANNDFPYSATIDDGLSAGNATFGVTAQWIDFIGDVKLSGFGNSDNTNITFYAEKDIRLSDLYYTTDSGGGSILGWSGGLTVPGDMSLTAARIYPTTQSAFTLNSGGTITTQNSGTTQDGLAYSAGGSVTLLADRINHEGVVIAPMGQIVMAGSETTELVDGELVTTYEPADRLFLAPGSELSTQGETTVNYGVFDSEGIDWFYANKGAGEYEPKTLMSEAPENRIQIIGSEVILCQDSIVDASGGGELFAYQFLPGVEGSSNPLAQSNQYVVLPDNRIQLPGKSVHLEGIEGLVDGDYILLPVEFAFMPDAMVIREIGVNVSQEQNRVTEEGYLIGTGYTMIPGTDIRSPVISEFEVRPASEVLTEGNFTTESLVCGDAGNIRLQGSTTIINGNITGSPLPPDGDTGYEGGNGGVLILSGKEVVIGEAADQVDIVFSHEVEENLQNILSVGTETLSNSGLGEVQIGEKSLTESITISPDSSITAKNLTLTAKDNILLSNGAGVRATGGEGIAELSAGNQIIVDGNATVYATDNVIIDTNHLDLGSGTLEVQNSTLTLKSDSIYLASDGYTEDGLLISPELVNQIVGASNISLSSRSDIFFQGGVDLAVDQDLFLNAERFVGLDAETVNLSAAALTLSGGNETVAEGLENIGNINVEASELFMIKDGDIRFEGFSDVNFNSQGELTFSGQGSLNTSGGDLKLSAAEVNTAYYQPQAETAQINVEDGEVPVPELVPYIVADFQIDAGNGSIQITSTGVSDGVMDSTPGGQLTFVGEAIEIDTQIDLPAGRLSCLSGNGGVSLMNDARILTLGTDSAPAGTVILSAGNNGNIQMAQGALIDVSSGSQGDAGEVSLSTTGGRVNLDGDLIAMSSGGQGGSFSLEEDQLTNISAITDHLTGFTGALEFRSHTGDIAIDTNLTAESVQVTADNGDLTLSANIDADSDNGNNVVKLNAGSNLNLNGGASISARGIGTDSDGGVLFLNAAEGNLVFQEGAEMNVSGTGSGMDGSVVFRAKREGSDNVRMELDGTVTGSSEILVESVAVYENISSIDTAYIATLNTETQSYLNSVAAGTTVDDLLNSMTVQDRNGTILAAAEEAALFNLIPGIEIRSPDGGNLTLKNSWELTDWRFNGEPGALTLRSAGDLTISADLNDSPTTPVYNLPGESGMDSWGIRLISGSDFNSADLMATASNESTITIDEEIKVYTESGQLWFASSGDTTIYTPQNTGATTRPLSMGTYDGNILGNIGGDLNLHGGVIQSGTGNIQINVKGDMNLTTGGTSNSLGAIRTTGQMPDPSLYPDITPQFVGMMYWEYSNGGDICIDISGDISGEYSLEAWDYIYKFSMSPGSVESVWVASYEGISSTQGIATMADGDLTIKCGGDLLGQAGTFGKGDFSIYAGGDIDGRFLVSEGVGRLSTMGSIGTMRNLDNQTIEIMNAQVWVDAQGHIDLGAVINPTIAGTASNQNLYSSDWNLTYSYEGQFEGAANSAVYLNANTGDVILSGQSAYGISDSNIASLAPYQLLPPVVSIDAANDIYIQNDFVLAPSPTGDLSLNAGNNIYSQYLVNDQIKKSWIQMPDLDPDLVYGYQETRYNNMKEEMVTHLLLVRNYNESPDQPLHQNDSNPVSITAGNNIHDLKLFLPKKAEINAGNNIIDLYYEGQNIHADDVTSIHAGNSILYTSEAFTVTDPYKGITHGGTGLLWVSADNQIDLGTTEGIQTVGNLVNPILSDEGSHAVIVAGYDLPRDEVSLRSFFNEIQTIGVEYSNKLAEGDPEGAEQIVQTLHETVINPFFASDNEENSSDNIDTVSAQILADGEGSTEGDLNMVRSQISSQGDNGDVFVISQKDMNVGLTTFNTDSDQSEEEGNSGIFTAGGGDIFAFAGKDVNVNESRVMTFYGGDITVWSDSGNINAGRGSKTAVSATPASATKNESGEYEVKFKPPAVGSGMRTLTFDPDGAAGSQEAPLAGDVYLFAPSGEIDAGEAGISGSNVILGAVSVVNVQNISFSQGAVGVPSASEATATVGALTGSGAISEASKMADASAAIQAANKQFEQDAKAMEKAFMPTWLRVEFMGFDIEDEEWSEHDET